MSREQFDDDCPGCKPAILDVQTGQPLNEDHPIMVKVMTVWDGTTLAERQAYHNVMCQNSREPSDLELVNRVISKIETICAETAS